MKLLIKNQNTAHFNSISFIRVNDIYENSCFNLT